MKTHMTSASGVISLLDEPDEQLKVFALEKLNKIVDVFWAEIAEAVVKIEVLYESHDFCCRDLAALVASKVYYHLGAYEDSLKYALGALTLFDVTDTSEYVSTIKAKCMDQYTKTQVINAETQDDAKMMDTRLEAIVNRMFQRCFDDKQYKQVVGIALETRRIDMFEKAILESDDPSAMLAYSLKVCLSHIMSRHFRNDVLRVLTELYMRLKSPDYISVCQCYIFLDDHQSVANILEKLIKGNEESQLKALQIAFDLYESATQQFLQEVQNWLRQVAPAPLPSMKTEEEKQVAPSVENKEEKMEVDEEKSAEAATPAPASPSLTEDQKDLQEKIVKLYTILGGENTIKLHLDFLIRNNKTDSLILKNTKDAVRNSLCHSATVIANSFMHCGTTCDQFLRDNLEWLARATNWAKFTATASLGVIHKGHEKDVLNFMSTYLPKDSSPGSTYSEGGGLYALGLIHANHGGEITNYLLTQLKEATNEMVRHGGCLGLGLAAMGTAQQDIFEQLRINLYQDDAVTGEAAGLAMGLVMLGTKNDAAIHDMLVYAQDTQHEKILRGLSVGIALTMYGRMEEADELVKTLSQDKDPILRWSGMYTLAMAYCGSGNNQAIRKLLHIAVSDVNDDVRRVAVTSLGFLLFRTPEKCPQVVSLLSESYNPHVRFGAAMALGIACAGTGLKEALTLLEPMTNDPVNYVRQGALIASALVLIQQNEITCPKVTHFRQLYTKVITDKHDDVMAKFGAILAQGILDAGGRNVTISLQSRTGHTNMEAVVGMLVFCQYWFWYPLTHFLSLAFKPTCIIGLNNNLLMPKVQFRSNAKPSTFAYPPHLEEKKDKTKEKVKTAVLSITAKQKKKEAEKKEKEEKMDVDEETSDEPEKKTAKTEKKEEKKEAVKDKDKDKKEEGKEEKKEEEKEKKPEANFELLDNPARVMRAQLRMITMPDLSRYTSVKDVTSGGIIMLHNRKPDDLEDLVEPIAAGGPKVEEESEPEPPEPFEWTED